MIDPLTRAFGMEVLAHHPHLSDDQIAAGAVPACLEALLRASDVVPSTCP